MRLLSQEVFHFVPLPKMLLNPTQHRYNPPQLHFKIKQYVSQIIYEEWWTVILQFSNKTCRGKNSQFILLLFLQKE